MGAPKRRTVVVLGSLIGAMTLAAGLLLALEPSPVVPISDGLMATSVSSHQRDPEAVLFDTLPAVDARRWQAIVIHHSGARQGSAETLNAAHEKLGLGGLGYHFVVNNGRGAPDGQIQLGFRWKRQMVGAYTGGKDGEWYNRNALGICVIGDPVAQAPTETQLSELVWLVRKLQQRFEIPADRVLIQGDRAGEKSAPLFPLASFRQRLLATPGK